MRSLYAAAAKHQQLSSDAAAKALLATPPATLGALIFGLAPCSSTLGEESKADKYSEAQPKPGKPKALNPYALNH